MEVQLYMMLNMQISHGYMLFFQSFVNWLVLFMSSQPPSVDDAFFPGVSHTETKTLFFVNMLLGQ